MSKNENKDCVKKKNVNVLESIQTFVDTNIRLIQNGLYIVGGIGVIVAARSIYVTKIFTKVEDIPAQFLRDRVKLRGKVQQVHHDGMLSIEHIPILRLKIPFVKQNIDCLPVKLACIDVSPEGRLWLNRNILHKAVWFHLLHRNGSLNGMGSQLYSKIEIPRRFRGNIHVNEELIRLGLSKISSLSHLEENDMLLTNQNLLLYLDQLVKLEDIASKKGIGMWKQPEENSWRKKSLTAVGSILSSPFRAIKWMYKKWRHKE
ncbi:protein C3orf33-like [Ruditapes philippinarum]|uniref:protein C3orf33-like n=1 Tax=Ruditapes philippinarum TaxID=129788 RepID=UPI00295A6799|nr:protein C3orf33-like [Ruditapes philippinarum]